MKASERPEGVIIKYRQLLNTALKDQATLDELENQYRALSLEKARSKDPWELITKPTLLPYPIGPNKKRMLALGLIGGTILGFSAALIADKKKDIIFSIAKMKSCTKWPLLAELSYGEENRSWEESLDLVSSCMLNEIEGNIALIAIGEIEESILKNLLESFQGFLKDREIIITKNLLKAKGYSNLIVITAMGITKTKEIYETRKKILIQNKPILGFISLNKINFKT